MLFLHTIPLLLIFRMYSVTSVVFNSFVTSWTVARQDFPWNFPGKITGVDCHVFLQGIFSTHESNPWVGRFFTAEPLIFLKGHKNDKTRIDVISQVSVMECEVVF